MKQPTCVEKNTISKGRIIALAIASLLSVPAFAQPGPFFAPGNLVVTVEGCGVHGGTCTAVPNGAGNGTGNSSVGGYGDNQAAPLTLFQYAPNGTASVTYVNSLVLPQTGSGANLPVSGEYGSSSEGGLQLSGTGQYLTIMGYGINAATFDAAYNPLTTMDPFGALPSGALAQSGSLTGQSYAPVARVLTLIDANGNINSATALYNIFNTNNPRSVYTVDGTTFAYVSGQGSGCDMTGGVFYFPIGVPTTSPTAITGLDASATSTCLSEGSPSTISQDTRGVQIYNNTLYVAVDSTEGKSFNRSFIGTLGTPPATTLYVPGASDPYSTGPTMLTGFGNTGGTGKETMTAGIGNNLNAGLQINLSPVNYFFANASTLYVSDSGHPKQTSATSALGDGGLQKWINSQANGSGTWSLAYTLYQGLNLVANTNTDGTTGLYGLAGTVSGNTVQLYVTNYTLSDLDPTYLYGITDTLSNTTPPGTSLAFTLLDTAPSDSNFKGVSFSPTIPAGDVEVTSSPSGLAFNSSGTGCAPGNYTTPQTLSWTPGTSCNLNVATTQAGAAGVQYSFAQWEDATTNPSHVVNAPETTATYTATFTTEYQLTTAAGTGGSVSPGGFVASGTDATITATPSSGYYFVNFTGATTSTSNPLSLLMTGPASIMANFALVMSQNITFGPLSNQVYGTAPFMVSATASSGLTVSFASLTTAVCTVSGTTVTLVAAGACTVQATQAGNAAYTVATPVSQTFQVTKATPTVTFTGAPASAPFGATFTVTATTNASSTAVIFFSGPCSLAGATVTITAPSGTCVLTASWAADNNYIAATAAQLTIATMATPTITWATPAAITYGTALSGVQLNATAT